MSLEFVKQLFRKSTLSISHNRLSQIETELEVKAVSALIPPQEMIFVRNKTYYTVLKLILGPMSNFTIWSDSLKSPLGINSNKLVETSPAVESQLVQCKYRFCFAADTTPYTTEEDYGTITSGTNGELWGLKICFTSMNDAVLVKLSI